MTRETKIGLLVGLMFIVAFGLVLSSIMPRQDAPSAFSPESRAPGSGLPMTGRSVTVSSDGVDDPAVPRGGQANGVSSPGGEIAGLGPSAGAGLSSVTSGMIGPADMAADPFTDRVVSKPTIGGRTVVAVPTGGTLSEEVAYQTPAEVLEAMHREAGMRSATVTFGHQTPEQTGGATRLSDPVPPTPVTGQKYVTVQGDTLHSLARKFYGQDKYVSLLKDANKAVVPNPNNLKIGTVLVIPPLNATAGTTPAPATPADRPTSAPLVKPTPTVPVPAGGETAIVKKSPAPASGASNKLPPLHAGENRTVTPKDTYTVVQGDTLFGISRKCGTPVSELIKLNKLANPDSLRIGQVLVLK